VGVAGGVGSIDALVAARKVRSLGINALVLDTSSASGSRPARELADAAGAEYVALDHASGKGVSAAVRERILAQG